MKSIYTFSLWPYEASHLREVASSSFARQLYPPKKAHILDTAALSFRIQLCSIFLSWRRTTLPRIHAQRSMQTRRFNLITAIPFSPNPHHPLHVCLREPSHVQNSYSKQSPWTLKRHKDQEKVHVCSSVQESSSYVLQLGLRKTKKVKWKTVHLTAG